MKKEVLNESKHPVIDGYVFGIYGVTPERLKELQNSPQVLAMDAQYERLENGTATEDERIDHEIRIEMMNRMPLDKMTSYHW